MKPDLALVQAMRDRSLLRLLAAIGEEQSIGTRRLLEKFGGNDLHKKILEAERAGYIEREKVEPEGKGNWSIYNRLSPKGRRLVQLAQQVGAWK
jgi:hypothetical protein